MFIKLAYSNGHVLGVIGLDRHVYWSAMDAGKILQYKDTRYFATTRYTHRLHDVVPAENTFKKRTLKMYLIEHHALIALLRNSVLTDASLFHKVLTDSDTCISYVDALNDRKEMYPYSAASTYLSEAPRLKVCAQPVIGSQSFHIWMANYSESVIQQLPRIPRIDMLEFMHYFFNREDDDRTMPALSPQPDEFKDELLSIKSEPPPLLTPPPELPSQLPPPEAPYSLWFDAVPPTVIYFTHGGRTLRFAPT